MADLTLRNNRSVIENEMIDELWLAYGFRYPAATDAATLRALGSTAMPDRALRFVSIKGFTYIWRRFSVEADDGDAYIQPSDVSSGSAGRWEKTDSTATSGYLKRCDLYNDDESSIETIEERLFGNMPAMLLSYEGRSFKPKSHRSGALYFATLRFTLLVVSVCERAEQTARQGSQLAAEAAIDPGTSAMMGDAEDTLAGSDLGLADVAKTEIIGDRPVIRDLARARFVEALDLTVEATLTHPDKNLTDLEGFNMQLQLADVAKDGTADPANMLQSGLSVPIANGLTQMVAAGLAVIDGAAATFIGEAHAFGANHDTYRDLLADGTMIYVAVDNYAPEPPVTSLALRIGVTATDGVGVVADRILCASAVDFGDVNQIS